MDIPVQRDLDARMSEQLAERFHINAAFDALGGKGVPQGVKVMVRHGEPLCRRGTARQHNVSHTAAEAQRSWQDRPCIL